MSIKVKDLKQLPLAILLSTGAGLLMHDMRLDQAASVRMIGSNYFNNLTTNKMYKFDNFHIHSERASYQANQPKTQTRLNEDKRYIVNKRLASSNSDFDYIWPSV